jgi:uncharacterized membrane protein YfcA
MLPIGAFIAGIIASLLGLGGAIIYFPLMVFIIFICFSLSPSFSGKTSIKWGRYRKSEMIGE